MTTLTARPARHVIKGSTLMYMLMLLLVSVVIAGVCFDSPRHSAVATDDDTPAATVDTTPVTDSGPVTDAKVENAG